MLRTLFTAGRTLAGLCLLAVAYTLVSNYKAFATPVPLANPTATVEQGGFPITNTLANDTAGWATNGVGSIGVYQVSPTFPVPDGFFVKLTFTLDSDQSGGCCANHVLGKFRLSYTQSVSPTTVSGATWVQLPPLTASAISSNPVTFLANDVLEATDVNANVDIITVSAEIIPTSYPFTIRGFRLEAIQDAGTGNYQGPGIPGNNNFVFDYFAVDAELELVPVPEPSTLVLAGLGIVGAVVARRRRVA